jgi:DNA-directed RNA polymerase subunit M/transcription elongation factor TFIIS
MRDGIRKKLVDLIASSESSEQRKSQATKVALAIED